MKYKNMFEKKRVYLFVTELVFFTLFFSILSYSYLKVRSIMITIQEHSPELNQILSEAQQTNIVADVSYLNSLVNNALYLIYLTPVLLLIIVYLFQTIGFRLAYFKNKKISNLEYFKSSALVLFIYFIMISIPIYLLFKFIDTGVASLISLILILLLSYFLTIFYIKLNNLSIKKYKEILKFSLNYKSFSIYFLFIILVFIYIILSAFILRYLRSTIIFLIEFLIFVFLAVIFKSYFTNKVLD